MKELVSPSFQSPSNLLSFEMSSFAFMMLFRSDLSDPDWIGLDCMILFRSVLSDSDLAGMMSDVPDSDFVQLRRKLRLKCLKGMNEPVAESEKTI